VRKTSYRQLRRKRKPEIKRTDSTAVQDNRQESGGYKAGSTARNSIPPKERHYFIGGSDARIVMGNDEAGMGEPRYFGKASD
jgi:hypothetical protein